MNSTTGGGKICIVCGDDCAGKPRTKDPNGNYYCRGCYDQMTAQRKARQHLADDDDAAISLAAPHPADDDDMPDILGELLDELESPGAEGQQGSVAAPPIARAMSCPACGAMLAPNAILCTACGYNTNTGGKLKSSIRKPERPRSSVWPIVFGIISILLGCGGLLFGLATFGANLIAVSSSADSSAAIIGVSIASSIPIGLAAWLTVSAIGVLLRRGWGVRNLRAWAITKLALTLVCGGALVLMVAIASGSTPASIGGDDLSSDYAIGTLSAIMLIQIIWPITVLVWLRRDAVQQEIRNW